MVMIETLPQICDKCGSSSVDTRVNRANTERDRPTATVKCMNCDALIADAEVIVNYKSPVVDDE